MEGTVTTGFGSLKGQYAGAVRGYPVKETLDFTVVAATADEGTVNAETVKNLGKVGDVSEYITDITVF